MNGHQVPGRYGVVCQGNSVTTSPLPSLTINYTNGSPGSYFTLHGSGFPFNSSETIVVNDHDVKAIQIDQTGNFALVLSTHESSDGNYVVTTRLNASSPVAFTLFPSAPRHSKEASGVECNLQGVCRTKFTYLPLLHR